MLPGNLNDTVSGASLEAGRTYAAWFPFKREKYLPHYEYEDPASGGGPQRPPPERDTWVPGWKIEIVHAGPEDIDESPSWDGDGAMLLTVVSLHKPGPTYPTRAFYVRQWRDPDGRVFGKANLRCITASALKAWLRGSKTAHLFEDRRSTLESSRVMFFEAMALAAADTSEAQLGPGRPS